MIELKADFHLHTADDRYDNIAHTSYELISHAAQKGFKVLSITNHDTYTFNPELVSYALDHDILLIPGIEKTIEGKHVLLLNAFPAAEKIKSFAELQAAKNDGLFVVAPHPFFKAHHCLGNKLIEHIDLFDAVEYSYFYTRWINFNRKARAVAREYRLPLIGNSDCHVLSYMGLSHSVITAYHKTENAVFDAIREHRVKVVSHPQPFHKLLSMFINMQIMLHMNGKDGRMEPADNKPFKLPLAG